MPIFIHGQNTSLPDFGGLEEPLCNGELLGHVKSYNHSDLPRCSLHRNLQEMLFGFSRISKIECRLSEMAARVHTTVIALLVGFGV